MHKAEPCPAQNNFARNAFHFAFLLYYYLCNRQTNLGNGGSVGPELAAHNHLNWVQVWLVPSIKSTGFLAFVLFAHSYSSLLIWPFCLTGWQILLCCTINRSRCFAQ